MVDEAREHITVAAPLERCFAVITDFTNYPAWAPDIKQAEVRAHDESGRPVEVEFRAAAMGRSVSVHLRYDYTEAPDRLSWHLLDGDLLERYEGSYRLEVAADRTDATEVHYELTVELGVPIPGFVKRRAEAKIIKAALPALKHHIESETAPR